MSKRFYTADWHLNSQQVLKLYNRPFPNVEYMNEVLISMCNLFAKKDDIVIHIGDLCCYGPDRGVEGDKTNPNKFIDKLYSTFVNLEGNHDKTNKVKSIGKCIRTTLGPFTDVSIGHYPSTHKEAAGTFLPGDIHLCGHVHDKWKYLIDKDNQVLNINMGIDVWSYKIVEEDKLINFIRKIMQNQIKKV